MLTQDSQRRIVRADIAIEGETIAAIGDDVGDGDLVIDAVGDIIMPGLVNTHTHVAMANMRGVADDMRFTDFLNTVFRYDSGREEDDLAAGTDLGCMEMIMGGTTTFMDLYYSEDVICERVEASGLRAVLCWCVLDADKTTQVGDPYDNMVRFCESVPHDARVRPGVGLQGIYVCSDDTMIRSKDYAVQNDLALHLHLSETRKEVNDCREQHGMRPVEYLDSFGFWNRRCVAAHSAWLTINEVRVLARNGVSISTCPVSNMKLATGGLAPIPEFIGYDMNVSVGTDGSTTNNSLDMLAETKTLGLLHKCTRWDAEVLPAQSLIDMATIGGAKALGMEADIGSIVVGKRADMIILDGSAPNLQPLREDNLVSNIVYSANAGNVRATIVDGRLLMLDRELLTVDGDKVIERARDTSDRLLRIGRI